MAKSRSTKKSSAKKSSRKKAVGKSASAKKKTARKPVTKKKAAAAKKKTKKKSAASTGARVAAKKAATRKPVAKKQTTKKQTKKKQPAKAPAAKATKPKASRAKKEAKKPADRKRGRSVAEVASSTAADEKGYVFINGRRVRMISTQGLSLPKKQRTTAAAEQEAAAERVPVKALKTRLTAKQLRYYRDLLLVKRAELVGDLSAMEAEALRSSGGNLSHMPIHMADIGTDTYDQDFMLGLAETERKQLREIDDALRRIEDKTYGVCQMTGKDIPRARLEAKPWAKYTIEAARLVENQMLS